MGRHLLLFYFLKVFHFFFYNIDKKISGFIKFHEDFRIEENGYERPCRIYL